MISFDAKVIALKFISTMPIVNVTKKFIINLLIGNNYRFKMFHKKIKEDVLKHRCP